MDSSVNRMPKLNRYLVSIIKISMKCVSDRILQRASVFANLCSIVIIAA